MFEVVYDKKVTSVIGFFNDIKVDTLRKKDTPYVAAVPNNYHGVKISYHKTPEEARNWINEESNPSSGE